MPKKKEKPVPRMHCPKCGSDDLDVHTIDRDDRSMSEEIDCNTCGKSWTEHYKLVLEEIVEDEDE